MYITTPIYYASGRLHLGHTYTTIMADAIKKYYVTNGKETFFLTGSDEHGEKIEKKALENNMKPIEYVDQVVDDFKNLWKILDVDYDRFIRTTDENHKKYVQNIFLLMLEKEDIYLGEYVGKYCTSCETYILKVDETDVCPDCFGNLKILREECYFFKCSKYQKKLEEFYKENPNFLLPLSRKNEIFNSFFKEGIKDLAISRKNLSWGIDTGTNNEHKIYVWLDALFNYKSAVEDEKLWPADVHIVGKEITRFHAIYWPMFLMSIEEKLPKKIISHGWLLMDEIKMSKSKGNVIYAEPIIRKYGSDSLKFYLLSEMKLGADGNFSPKLFLEKYNGMLVNELSNLISRTYSMSIKYLDGQIDRMPVKIEVQNKLEEIKIISAEMMKIFDFPGYITNVWKIIKFANKYIDISEPWKLGKKNNKAEVSVCLYNLWYMIEEANVLLYPIIPNSVNEIKTFYTMEASRVILTGKYKNLFNRLDLEIEISSLIEEIKEESSKAKRKLGKND